MWKIGFILADGRGDGSGLFNMRINEKVTTPEPGGSGSDYSDTLHKLGWGEHRPVGRMGGLLVIALTQTVTHSLSGKDIQKCKKSNLKSFTAYITERKEKQIKVQKQHLYRKSIYLNK